MPRIAAVLAAMLLAATAAAEPIGYFTPEGTRYNPSIPAPESVIGHELGDKPVRHDMLVRYLREVAARSDRLSIETIGYSHEGRPIEFLIATSPDNHARLEDIRQAHLALNDPGSETGIAEDMPVVTWLNYGVHGAESSGMDAALPVVYHLAAAQGEAIERQLAGSVILITAIFNPDGHSRRVNHVYRFGSEVSVTDPAHEVHNLWMDARTNHYWFDLNRQWLLQTQPESQAWMGKWHHWKPNLTVDYHEMGSNSTYYFHPGVPERKNPLIPDRSRELLVRMAGFHAASLDAQGRLYYSEEGFDNFYIGKGSTYPHVNGSVGILFEAGAARGGRIETPNGIRSYAGNIKHHFTTSLSSIAGAHSLRGELLEYRMRFVADAQAAGADDRRRAFVFTSHDRSRLAHFTDLMLRHDIRVHELAEAVEVSGVAYRPGEAYVIPLDQPQYTMIRGIFDRVREFESPVFYDVSGWTLPLAYDLDYAPLERQFDSDQLGAPATPGWPQAAAPARSDYGYMIDGSDYYAPRALYRLLDADVIVRAAQQPVTVLTESGERDFERGALFVPLAGQTVAADRIHALLTGIAEDDGIAVSAVLSGRTPGAGGDLGSGQSFDSVKKPRVLLVIGDGILNYDPGEVWHLLDYRMRMPVTIVDKRRLRGLDWSRYTHLVLSGGRSPGLGDKTTERVKQWVREEGGTFIGLRQAAKWGEESLLGRKPEKNNDKQDDKTGDATESARHDYASLQVRDAEDVVGGAIFASDLDITHPLGFGYRDRFLPSHRNTTLVLQTPENPYATVARYLTEDPVLSGYASERRIREIAGAPMAVAEREGRGSVILFADNLNFRGTFLGTSRLFLNALFFSDDFRTPRSDGAAMEE